MLEVADFAVTVADERDGATRSFVSGDDVEVTLRGDVGSGYLGVQVRPAGETPYLLDFGAPVGQPLRTKRYDETGDIRTAEHGEQRVGLQGHSCGDQRGAFEVRQLTEDLRRVWITFHNSCGDTLGEVRVGVPEPDATVRVVPRRLDWAPRATGARSVPVDVRFTNTGAGAQRIRGVVVDRGGAHYRVARTGCRGVLRPGASCTAGIVHAPEGRWDGPRPGRVTLRAEDDAGRAVMHRVPMVAEDLGGWWGLRARDNKPTRYRVGPTLMSFASLGPGQVIDVGTGDATGPRLGLRVVPPRGQRFVAGRTYEGRYPSDPPTRRQAEMSVDTQGESCRGRGGFTVHEIEYDSRGHLDRLSMTFFWDCSSAGHDVRGTVAVHASEPSRRPRSRGAR